MLLVILRVLGMINKCQFVVIRVLQPKIDVSSATASQDFDRVVALPGDCLHPLCKLCKSFLTNRVQKRGLVFEVEIDRCRRVFDLFGDSTHRDVFVTFIHEQLTRGVQNILTQLFLLSLSSLLRSHLSADLTTYSHLTPLSIRWIRGMSSGFYDCDRSVPCPAISHLLVSTAMATLQFLGATGTVTGSKYVIDVHGSRMIVDC